MYAGRFGRGAVDSVSGRADTGSTASLLRLGGVDLTPRQTELADAALRLLAREGMPAVTFRAVAAESGWSLGAVQKAYASKSALLAAMFARLREAAQPRVTTEPGRPTLHEWLVGLFLSIMPLDERRRDLQLQGSAFTQRAAYDPAVAAAMSLSDNEIRGLLGGLGGGPTWGGCVGGRRRAPPAVGPCCFPGTPAASPPSPGRWTRGRMREALFPVFPEVFMTDPADTADIVLPATSNLEQADLHKAYGHTLLRYNLSLIHI